MVDARGKTPILEVRDLNVFYGQSHAVQGVNLTLESGVLSVVGRNGMGKTTLCKAIMGMVPTASGSISFNGQSLAGLGSAEIARLGIGYVPQGRRLWKSLTVDDHLQLVATKGGAWTPDRIYGLFPRLAERKSNGGAQLSGGEQQMLAIGRALLLNPRLLVMDEPTEGLAPVIVKQVADLLVRLGQEGDIDVLVIEQNIGVACSVAAQVAIMVNGKVNRLIEADVLAADRDLQQALLGVGRHAHDETPMDSAGPSPVAHPSAAKIYLSNPKLPTRWMGPVPVSMIVRSARTVTPVISGLVAMTTAVPVVRGGLVYICGMLDTDAVALRRMRDILKGLGVPVALVDLSTSTKPSGADVPPNVVAGFHPRGSSGVFSGDPTGGMTLAFERWLTSRNDVAGVLAAGDAAIVVPAFSALPLGMPKVILSQSFGDMAQLNGVDITLMTDPRGLTEVALSNAAYAMAAMVKARQTAPVQTSLPPNPRRASPGRSMQSASTANNDKRIRAKGLT